MGKTARSPFFCRSPFPLMSGTEGRTGRGLRESAVCGIKVIFARVAELVDALDLESSGLSIRVQVPSLAPEFAKTSPACCGTSLFSGRLSGSVFPGPRQGRGVVPVAPGKAVPLPCAERSLYPLCGGPVPRVSSARPFLREAGGYTARPRPVPSPSPHACEPRRPSPSFPQRNAFHLDRHASVLIFDGRELPGDRRPAA